MNGNIIVYLGKEKGKKKKQVEWFFLTNKTSFIKILELVEEFSKRDKVDVLCVWKKDTSTGPVNDWEVVASFDHKAEDVPENAEYFLEQAGVKTAKGQKPLYDPPFKIVVANYKRDEE